MAIPGFIIFGSWCRGYILMYPWPEGEDPLSDSCRKHQENMVLVFEVFVFEKVIFGAFNLPGLFRKRPGLWWVFSSCHRLSHRLSQVQIIIFLLHTLL
jgi:hypothetical protein